MESHDDGGILGRQHVSTALGRTFFMVDNYGWLEVGSRGWETGKGEHAGASAAFAHIIVYHIRRGPIGALQVAVNGSMQYSAVLYYTIQRENASGAV